MAGNPGALGGDKSGNSVNQQNEPVLGLALNTNKAGMEKVDKKKVEQVILEASKNSKFYQNELRKAADIEKQVQVLLEKQKSITSSDIQFATREVEMQMELIEKQRDLTHFVVHVDMDAFYAAVEERDCPQYKNVPLAVGSNSMLSTSNYVARKYGVRAAMPGFIAKKLCPELKIVPPNFSKYQAASGQVQDLFRQYDPNFRMMSLDEAYLDFTQHMKDRETACAEKRTFSILQSDGETLKDCVFGCDIEQAVLELRQRVFTNTKLTCSAGIAANCLLAKVCSDKNKPNGQFYLKQARDEVIEFMRQLPIRSINGIGKVTESILKGLGVASCGDMFEKRHELFLLFSKSTFQYFLRVALGIGAIPDPDVDSGNNERKSMSCERTFKPLSRREDLLSVIQELCDELYHDLRKAGLYGQSLTLKVKLSSFEVKTRAIVLPYALHDKASLYRYSTKILDRFLAESSCSDFEVRLIGVRMAKFARKGTVSSLKSAVHNTVPLDKYLSSSKKTSEETDSQNHGTTSSGVAHSHLPSAMECNSNNIHEVYSCNLFEVSEDIENQCNTEHVGRVEDDEIFVSHAVEVPHSNPPDQQSVKPATRCIKSKNRSAETEANGSTVKRNVHFNLEPMNSHSRENVGKKFRSRDSVDTLTTKYSGFEGKTTSGAREGVTCPICGQRVPLKSDINGHVDNCLTMIEVRNVLKEQSGMTNRVNSTSTSGSPDQKKGKAEKRQGAKSKDPKNEGAQKKKRLKYDSNKAELQSSLSDFLNRN